MHGRSQVTQSSHPETPDHSPETAEEPSPFAWENWVLQGLQGFSRQIGQADLPPEFWQHLGRALCELGSALRLLGIRLPNSPQPSLLEEYERIMRHHGYTPDPPEGQVEDSHGP